MKLFAAMFAAWMMAAGVRAPAEPERAYGEHAFLARSQTREANESSGVTPSHYDPNVFWTHNDSGHPAEVFAFRLAEADRKKGVAADLGRLTLRGAPCEDWEEITSGPGNTIYLFDGGDNSPCHRANKCIIRFVEPKIDWSRAPVREAVKWESFRFEYPDLAHPGRAVTKNQDRYDAECLLVHPVTGDVYVVTKRDFKDKAVAHLYRLPAASIRWDARTVHVLEYVADLSARIPFTAAGGKTGMVTGGAVDPDGRHLLIRTYLVACQFTLPEGQPFEKIFEQTPQVISLVGEPQGEGICYAANGDLISTSEAIVFGPRFPIFITPRVASLASAPASAPAR